MCGRHAAPEAGEGSGRWVRYVSVFGLTVTEAMWKATPVIGGDSGGIRLQIEDGVNGYLVSNAVECAERIVDLLDDPDRARVMGVVARESVRRRFLMPRLLLDYLRLFQQIVDGDCRQPDEVYRGASQSAGRPPGAHAWKRG